MMPYDIPKVSLLSDDFQGEAMKNFDQWHTSDWQYANSKGQVFEGGKESRENVIQDYSFFTKYRHEPYQLAIWETSEGYVLE